MNHGMMEDAGSGGAIDDLGLEVAKLSAAAFAMAQVATERGDYAAHEASARGLDDRLAELRPRIEAAPAAVRPALDVAWTDARLDLEYIYTAGNPPHLSARMHLFLHNTEESV